MKIFKYKFTKLITVFIYLGIALSVAAAGVNTYLIIAEGIESANPVYDILQYVLTYLAAVLAFILLVSLPLSSYYKIDGKTFISSFGIIKSKYDISDIKSVVLDRDTNKLAVYFDENKYIVINVKEDWYEQFIDALLAANGKIEYTINSKENKADGDKKDK